MAVAGTEWTAAGRSPSSSFTMSLTQGWDRITPEDGGRPLAAGDVVVLAVLKPHVPVTGPPGWNRAEDGRTFWRMIGPPEKEVPPVFTAEVPPEDPDDPEDTGLTWEIKGWAVSGFAPPDDSGSSVPWTGFQSSDP